MLSNGDFWIEFKDYLLQLMLPRVCRFFISRVKKYCWKGNAIDRKI